MSAYHAELIRFVDGSEVRDVNIAFFNGALKAFVFVASRDSPDSGNLYNADQIKYIKGITLHNRGRMG